MFWGGFFSLQADFQLETRVCACPKGRQQQQRHPLVLLPANRAWQNILSDSLWGQESNLLTTHGQVLVFLDEIQQASH